MARAEERTVRWWIAALVLALTAAGLVAVWSGEDQRQEQVLRTMGLVLLTVLLLLLWVVLLSGLRWRTRGAIVLAFGLLLALGAALFELRGFSGDLVPRIGWRFGARAVGPPEVEERRDEWPREQTWRDFPRFLGPRGDGHLPDVALAADWDATPPVEMWRRTIGEGCSGFAVVGDLAVTQEQRGEEEYVVAYDLLTGAVRWAHGRTARHETAPGGVGPRATPTIDGGRVFAFGATGILDCLVLETGARLWTHDAVLENGGRVNDWGMSGSPLVVEERVIVSAGGPRGGSLVAYGVADGALAWSAGDAPAGYSSPRLVRLRGVEQVLIVNQGLLVAHDPRSGAILWETPWGGASMNVADAVVLGDQGVLVSSGYGEGAARFDVRRDEDGTWRANEVWRSRALKAKFSNFLVLDGLLFGFDDGILTCVDAATGERRWKDGRFGHGQLLRVGEHLLVLGEFGEVLLLAPDPEELRVLARKKLLDDKTWNSPTLAAPYLLLRNDREAACYRLAAPLVAGEAAR